jgi:hypothetical protein
MKRAPSGVRLRGFLDRWLPEVERLKSGRQVRWAARRRSDRVVLSRESDRGVLSQLVKQWWSQLVDAT